MVHFLEVFSQSLHKINFFYYLYMTIRKILKINHMIDTVLFGLFDKNDLIKNELKQEVNINNSKYSNLFLENFESFDNNIEQLHFSGILYNKSDLEKFLGLKSENNAELIYHLFSKENFQGFKRINGKFLIIIQSDNKTIVARDRYGQGPLFYYNDRFFTNLFW